MQEFGHQAFRETKLCTMTPNSLGRRHGIGFIYSTLLVLEFLGES